MPLSGAAVAAAVDGRLLGAGTHEARRAVIDSRRVEAGDCFFAILGERDDGHRYVPEALAAGAALVVVHREPDPELLAAAGDDADIIVADDTTGALQALAAHVRTVVDPTVIGVTGSVGKTTTKELLAALLGSRFTVHATPGNLNNQWGLPLSLLGLEPGHRFMVAELAMSGAGEIRDLARIARPAVGVITNIAAVHMQFFTDLEEVAAAKAELAEELPADGVLIVNADDPRTVAIGERFAPRLERVVGFGLGADATVRAEELADDGGEGWRLRLQIGAEEPLAVRLSLAGEHSLSNFLAAAAAAWVAGMRPAEIAAAASTLELPDKRGRRRRLASGIDVIDESYNASPLAVRKALEALVARPAAGRRVAVLGDMLELGDWSGPGHREIGEHAASLGVDLLVAVGRQAALVARGAVQRGMDASAIRCFAGAEEAATGLLETLRAGDLVLVKGSRAVGMDRLIEVLAGASLTAPESAAREG